MKKRTFRTDTIYTGKEQGFSCELRIIDQTVSRKFLPELKNNYLSVKKNNILTLIGLYWFILSGPEWSCETG
jgi:hypothetical protein